MNFETLEEAWGKQSVRGAELPVEKVIAGLKAEVRSAQRRFRGAMVTAVGLLLLGWLVTAGAHAAGIKRFTALGFASELVGSAIYVGLLLRARHSARVARNEIEQMGGTLPTSLAATLRTVELQIQNARIAAYAIPSVVAIAGGLYLIKYFAGEFPSFGVIWGVVGMAAMGAMIGGAIWYRYRRELKPRREELLKALQRFEC